MEKFELLVIGGGPAAITLAKNIQKKMKVGIIRPEDHSMVYCAMPYAIEKILPFEKTLKKDAIVTDTGAELIRDMVVKVDFDAKTVITMKNGEVEYEKLVIATGASPVLPPIDGHSLDGVMTFKTEEDLGRIMGFIEKGLKSAVVVGAGAIGIELAQALNGRGLETHLVDMADSILPNMVDKEMITPPQDSLIDSGIHLHLNSKVSCLTGNEHVEKVLLEDGESIEFAESNDLSGLVIFAVGMRPNVLLFTDTELETARDGIVVNGKMETNVNDVYAVGDCCQFTSAITGEVHSGKLATNAVPMARILAANLLGGDRDYPGFYNGSATKICDYFIGGTGLSEKAASVKYDVVTGFAEFTTIFPMMPGAKKVKLKLIADRKTHRILGGQFLSGEAVTDKVDKITMAIQYGVTLEQLLDFSYSAQPYQSFFPAHNLLVKAAEEVLKKL